MHTLVDGLAAYSDKEKRAGQYMRAAHVPTTTLASEPPVSGPAGTSLSLCHSRPEDYASEAFKLPVLFVSHGVNQCNRGENAFHGHEEDRRNLYDVV